MCAGLFEANSCHKMEFKSNLKQWKFIKKNNLTNDTILKNIPNITENTPINEQVFVQCAQGSPANMYYTQSSVMKRIVGTSSRKEYTCVSAYAHSSVREDVEATPWYLPLDAGFGSSIDPTHLGAMSCFGHTGSDNKLGRELGLSCNFETSKNMFDAILGEDQNSLLVFVTSPEAKMQCMSKSTTMKMLSKLFASKSKKDEKVAAYIDFEISQLVVQLNQHTEGKVPKLEAFKIQFGSLETAQKVWKHIQTVSWGEDQYVRLKTSIGMTMRCAAACIMSVKENASIQGGEISEFLWECLIIVIISIFIVAGGWQLIVIILFAMLGVNMLGRSDES